MCREQFVSLHSRPLLEELSEGLLSRFGLHNDSDDDSDPALSGPGSAPVPGPGSGSSSGSVFIPGGLHGSLKQTRDRSNKVLTAVPELGDFDLTQVLDSPYFFS